MGLSPIRWWPVRCWQKTRMEGCSAFVTNCSCWCVLCSSLLLPLCFLFTFECWCGFSPLSLWCSIKIVLGPYKSLELWGWVNLLFPSSFCTLFILCHIFLDCMPRAFLFICMPLWDLFPAEERGKCAVKKERKKWQCPHTRGKPQQNWSDSLVTDVQIKILCGPWGGKTQTAWWGLSMLIGYPGHEWLAGPTPVL